MPLDKGRTIGKRVLSMVLSVLLVAGLVPTTAFADETKEPTPSSIEQELFDNPNAEELTDEPTPTADAAKKDSDKVSTPTEQDVVVDPAESPTAPEVEVTADDPDEVSVEAQDPEAQNNDATANAATDETQLTTQADKGSYAVMLKAKAHVQKRGWLGWKQGYKVTIGTTGKGLRVEALRISRAGKSPSGSVVYQPYVQKKGWMAERRNGQIAGTIGKGLRVEAIKIRLTGELWSTYDVWYRTHVAGLGWLNWTCNGEAAGTKGFGKAVEAIQIALVPKGAGCPEDSSAWPLSFVEGEDVYQLGVQRTSGDPALDLMLEEFVRRCGSGEDGLKRACKIIAKYNYKDQDFNTKGGWQTWSIRMAKQMYQNKIGNCYRYASLMCWVARRLGYDARAISGWHYGLGHAKWPHGWCEITLDGEAYVIDPLYYKRFPKKKFFMVTYAKAPFKYHKSWKEK